MDKEFGLKVAQGLADVRIKLANLAALAHGATIVACLTIFKDAPGNAPSYIGHVYSLGKIGLEAAVLAMGTAWFALEIEADFLRKGMASVEAAKSAKISRTALAAIYMLSLVTSVGMLAGAVSYMHGYLDAVICFQAKGLDGCKI